MLAIQPSKTHQGRCTPNVLPCKINHNGPIDASKRYWAPAETEDGKTVGYFRGRKLHAKQVKVPEGYKGIVLSSTDRILPKANPVQGEVEEDDEETPEVSIMEEQSYFEEVMVWGHEALPEDTADPYVRGMEEWISFAGSIHSYSDGKVTSEKPT